MGRQRSDAHPSRMVHGGRGVDAATVEAVAAHERDPRRPAPQRFVDAEQEYLTALPGSSDRTGFARTEFDRLDKGKLR